MIDIVDPALKSSVQSRRIVKKYSFKHFAMRVLVIIAALALAGLIYITLNATLDTTPNESININDRIENIEFDGRLPPIQQKPTNE